MPDINERKAIEILISSLSPKDNKEWSYEEDREARKLAITALQALAEAKDELPDIGVIFSGHMIRSYLKLIPPVLAKKNMELKEVKSELDQTVEALETERDWAKAKLKDSLEANAKLKQENEELKLMKAQISSQRIRFSEANAKLEQRIKELELKVYEDWEEE